LNFPGEKDKSGHSNEIAAFVQSVSVLKVKLSKGKKKRIEKLLKRRFSWDMRV
jgi:hypothetical protein